MFNVHGCFYSIKVIVYKHWYIPYPILNNSIQYPITYPILNNKRKAFLPCESLSISCLCIIGHPQPFSTFVSSPSSSSSSTNRCSIYTLQIYRFSNILLSYPCNNNPSTFTPISWCLTDHSFFLQWQLWVRVKASWTSISKARNILLCMLLSSHT